MATACAHLLRLDELLGLWEEDTDDANGERSASTDQEENLVGIGSGTLRGESESEGSGEKVTKGVTLLEETSSSDGNGLETHGNCVTPDTAHTYRKMTELVNSTL